MLKLKGLILTGMGVAAMTGTLFARADTITQHWSFTNTGNATDNFSYNLFDSNLGTLTGVRYRLVDSNTATVQVYNFNGSPQAFTDAKTSVEVKIFGPPSAHQYIDDTVSATVASGTAAVGLNNYSGVTANHDVTQSFSPINFSIYQIAGGGAAGDQLEESTSAFNSTVTAGSGVLAGGSGTISADLYLYYDYTSSTTPEPGTWALLAASASISAIGIRRRRMVRK
jgi:hypothetical protein